LDRGPSSWRKKQQESLTKGSYLGGGPVVKKTLGKRQCEYLQWAHLEENLVAEGAKKIVMEKESTKKVGLEKRVENRQQSSFARSEGVSKKR